MTESDIDNILISFKEANKSLRKRAVTIGILTILTIGLVYMESVRESTVMDLFNYQYKLEKINELQDTAFKRVVDGDNSEYFPFDSRCNSCTEHSNLFKRVKSNNYDKKIIVEAIIEIDTKIDKVNEEKSISILGFSIPIRPMYYVFFLLMLVLFHDFTQVIIFRGKVYNRIKAMSIPSWKIGFELFGFYNTSNNPSLKFVRLTSSTLASIFILCPFITCLMMLNHSNFGGSYEEILTLLNIICLVLIIIDTLIIFHSENILGFRHISNVFLGTYRISRRAMSLNWIILTSGLGICFLMESFTSINASFIFKSFLFLFSIAPLVILYIVAMKVYDTPKKNLRGLRAALLIVNMCWVSHMFFRFYDPNRSYTFKDFEYILITWFIFAVISTVIAFVYTRFFLIDKFKTKFIQKEIIKKHK